MLRERDLHTASYARSLSLFGKGAIKSSLSKRNVNARERVKTISQTPTIDTFVVIPGHYCCSGVMCRVVSESGPKSTITTIIVIENEPSSSFRGAKPARIRGENWAISGSRHHQHNGRVVERRKCQIYIFGAKFYERAICSDIMISISSKREREVEGG